MASACGRCRSRSWSPRSSGLIAIPVYLDFSTANDSLRSVFDVGALVPLFGVTAFGRAILDLELCFALFCLAAWVSLWVDRPEREQRSVAELIAKLRSVAGRRRGADHSRRRRARRPDLAPRPDPAVRLASPGRGIGVAGRAGRTAGPVVRCAPARARAALRWAFRDSPRSRSARCWCWPEAARARPSITCRRSMRCGGPGYGQAILVKSGLLGGRAADRLGNLLRSRPRLVAAREPAGARASRPPGCSAAW